MTNKRRLLLTILLMGALTRFLFAATPAPELTLHDLTGKPQSLSQYRGKIVILNFWATWCVPCREEIPVLVRIQSEYAAQGVVVIGASLDDAETQKNIPEFVRDFRINFPVWIGATTEHAAAFQLGTSIPTTAIIDQKGNLCFRIIGKSKFSDLKKRLDYLLDGASKAPKDLVLPDGITREHFEQHHMRASAEHHEHEEEEGIGSEVPS